VPHLYDLTHFAPQNAGYCLTEVLKEKQQDFRQHSSSFPGLDTVRLCVMVDLENLNVKLRKKEI
jgi:hypothetical protein